MGTDALPRAYERAKNELNGKLKSLLGPDRGLRSLSRTFSRDIRNAASRYLDELSRIPGGRAEIERRADIIRPSIAGSTAAAYCDSLMAIRPEIGELAESRRPDTTDPVEIEERHECFKRLQLLEKWGEYALDYTAHCDVRLSATYLDDSRTVLRNVIDRCELPDDVRSALTAILKKADELWHQACRLRSDGCTNLLILETREQLLSGGDTDVEEMLAAIDELTAWVAEHGLHSTSTVVSTTEPTPGAGHVNEWSLLADHFGRLHGVTLRCGDSGMGQVFSLPSFSGNEKQFLLHATRAGELLVREGGENEFRFADRWFRHLESVRGSAIDVKRVTQGYLDDNPEDTVVLTSWEMANVGLISQQAALDLARMTPNEPWAPVAWEPSEPIDWAQVPVRIPESGAELLYQMLGAATSALNNHRRGLDATSHTHEYVAYMKSFDDRDWLALGDAERAVVVAAAALRRAMDLIAAESQNDSRRQRTPMRDFSNELKELHDGYEWLRRKERAAPTRSGDPPVVGVSGDLAANTALSAAYWTNPPPKPEAIQHDVHLPQEVYLAKLAELEAAKVLAGGGSQAAGCAPARDSATPVPHELLRGWHQICKAAGWTYDRRRELKRLNDTRDGPIKNDGSGSWPTVFKDNLVDWLDRIGLQFDDAENQREGRALSAASSHNFGRSGTAHPEISGGTKSRRTKPKLTKADQS